MRKASLSLLIAALTLAGCAASPKLLPPQSKPQLDSALAAVCEIPDEPGAADYDVWQAWGEHVVLPSLTTFYHPAQ
ncbi:hypothetical protein PHO31112_05428 [Pandoraea horticolens]|uniref:Lipoprotein n=1 Tax=Pandoraea horticolens TaxID=2508298 RepID=A0A5E4ZE37_9BURK|nr:hypothetical protein [Pandoraea horticolens]VVE59138.1 hypothetical protein PHO31112_05428 [Pandoraea horticolens]